MEKYLEKAELLIKNRDTIQKSFIFEDSRMVMAGAAVLMMRNREITKNEIDAAKKLISHKVGILSDIRSYAQVPVICMTAAQENPESYVDRALAAYAILKEKFVLNSYLPLPAFIMAQDLPEEKFEEIAVKAKQIYKLLQADHPFLTGGDDSSLCVISALCGRESSAFTEETDYCYENLKGEFFSKGSVLALSMVLALYDEKPDIKCKKVLSLFKKMKEAGLPYGTGSELSTLGFLAMGNLSEEDVIREMKEVDAWMKTKKGMGILSGFTEQNRLMYAGMLIQDGSRDSEIQMAAIESSIAILIIEDVIMYSAIIGTTTVIMSN